MVLNGTTNTDLLLLYFNFFEMFTLSEFKPTQNINAKSFLPQLGVSATVTKLLSLENQSLDGISSSFVLFHCKLHVNKIHFTLPYTIKVHN